MKRWNYTLDFTHFYRNDDFTINEKGKMVSKEINRVLKKYLDWDNRRDHFDFELEDITEGFNSVTGWYEAETGDSQSDTEVFDDLMNMLYDWCDSNRVWIKTR